ncbi:MULTISPECIES: glycoside hydrolase family 32 protein [Gluconobacter]|uniref:glycoside hydrolase family 32 protein n=1 Tax=Gluconobacter TaxID=441 RepID=UPI000A369FA0|nr:MULTISPECIES: glycoside hydrolase family 32 protein [Gluconobacter]MBS1036471.1 glycoside hydrolase family 32 protein [Gluconobacter cerinus]OUJ07501.1 sucrose-6-phosphate hydrolase [Gluconobacter sp. DsW_058]
MRPTSRRMVLGSGVALLALRLTHRSQARPYRLPSAAVMAADRLRPQYHLIAPYGWMNDPCGPVWVNGRYHMFYQWGPDKAAFGNIHWGHATSHDLVHWHHEPVAMSPVPGGPDALGVFSGCVVIVEDQAIAFYTGIEPSVQCTATSDLQMMQWKQNPVPVLSDPPPGLHVDGFRDPLVWKDHDGWHMLLGAHVRQSEFGPGGVILKYDNENLKDWTYRTLFYGPTHQAGAYDDAMECPDFFALGDTWVLIYSLGSTVYYASGIYSEGAFHPRIIQPLGYGALYAGRTMLDEHGRRVLWGWVPEKPERSHGAMEAGWSGVMSLPRVLTADGDAALRLAPHPNLAALEGPHFRQLTPSSWAAPDGPNGRMLLTFIGTEAGRLTFGGEGTFLELDYDPYRPGKELMANGDSAPLPLAARNMLDIFVDGSVVEIFTSSGVCLTTRAYGNTNVAFKLSVEGTFREAVVSARAMSPISPDRLTSSPV